MNTHELAWAAGFFDGEGYIGNAYAGRNRYLNLALQIGQKDRQVLDRFRQAVGRIGITVNSGLNVRKDNCYVLRVYNDNAVKVFNLLKPYLSPVKLEQGEKAIGRYEEDREQRYKKTG